MDERKIAAVARGMESRRRLGDVIADDRGVADLAIAAPELVVSEADGAGIMGSLGGLERLAEERNAARRLPAGDCELALEPPEFRQTRRMEPLPLFRRIAQDVGRLADVVLLKPRLGQRGAQLEGLVTAQPRLLLEPDEQAGGIPPVTPFQSFERLPERLRQCHAGSIRRIQLAG